MAKKYTEISENDAEFIKAQKVFFVGTAAPDGHVNISPKGMDTFRVLNGNRVVWLSLTGSGNETAAHFLENNRITVMFMALDGPPKILRLYGQGKIYHPRDNRYHELIDLFPKIEGSRQIIDIDVDMVQSSCGMSVPYYDFKGERLQLQEWAEKRGPAKIEKYWLKHNQLNIDGKPTGIFDKSELRGVKKRNQKKLRDLKEMSIMNISSILSHKFRQYWLKLT